MAALMELALMIAAPRPGTSGRRAWLVVLAMLVLLVCGLLAVGSVLTIVWRHAPLLPMLVAALLVAGLLIMTERQRRLPSAPQPNAEISGNQACPPAGRHQERLVT